MSSFDPVFKCSTIKDCIILDLPIVHRDNGGITSINEFREVPFKIKRIYYLYDIPGGEERGGHAHKELYQLVIAASGSFEVHIFDGISHSITRLDRPYQGLLIVPGIWRELKNFSSGAISLVLASSNYSETDYLRTIDNYLCEKLK